MNQRINFIASLLTFYLKGSINISDHFIQMNIPNTILRFIPLGYYRRNIPVDQIASVENNFSLDFKALIIGIILILVSLGLLTDQTFFGIILLILGINATLSSFQTYLIMTLNSGKVEGASFIIFEKSKALEAEEAIQSAIMNRLNNTNIAQSTDKIVDAINNK